ncbi:LytR/AlgR family response regulator transcription factor [Kriegella aquimaris]|uniref:Two component transcriptional regulator, LytTR family n=1 Tax=Kriegella aquimaris TaxID=192904 RepID=A0A1G9YEF4_9FLAO|nr:LytTR family DNA-binding domain-containing protein [Kriegella aquimaris]SDN07464.1 two component transcriptional regulator, LytTR family [Kriegella aquimaris]
MGRAMKCLIVDDDPLICNLLDHFCSKIQDISETTIATSGFEALNLINGSHFDLILLDFDLPDITGKDILKNISPQSAVIMATSDRNFASESYNYDHIVDYLVKPIDFARFFKGFQKAQNFVLENRKKESRLFIKEGNKLVKIKLEDVKYFKSESNYIAVVLKDHKLLTLMTLKDLEPKLPDFFQKVHRSYIVNLNRIDFIDGNAIAIDNDHIPVSQSYEKELLKKINLLN